MPVTQVSATPELVVEALTEKTLFQNQGLQPVILSITENMDTYFPLDPWESVTLSGDNSPIWVCAPMARNGYTGYIFWAPVVEEIP